jgi:hypothetical protein
MKVFRSIILNEGDEINTNNLGCSWTLDEIFAHNHGEEMRRAKKADGYIILEGEITEDMIDQSNTLYAMGTRLEEYEVILFTSDIEAEVMYSEIEGIEEGTVFSGNTGTNNFEDYNDNYEGSLSWNDFLEVAEQF